MMKRPMCNSCHMPLDIWLDNDVLVWTCNNFVDRPNPIRNDEEYEKSWNKLDKTEKDILLSKL